MAKIYFKHLSMKNFMSYESAELNLNREGNILVGGMNQNPEDSAKSNGCGKSTIFSALAWALTGETINGAKEVANIFTTGTTEVVLSFDLDNDHFEIKRQKNPSKLYFTVNGEDCSGKGIRDTEKEMAERIPQITSSLLNSVIILGQGLPQKFTNNTPSGRKDVLEKLSSSDFMITDLKDKLTKRKLHLSEQKRECEDFNLQYETTKKTLEQQVKAKKEELVFLPAEDTLEDSIKQLEEEIDELNFQKSEFEKDLETLSDLLDNSVENLKQVGDAEKDELAHMNMLDTTYWEDELVDQKAKLRALSTKITEYDSVTDICPTCGQKLPDIQKIDTTEMKKEERVLHDKVSEIEHNIREMINENNDKIAECKKKYADLQQEIDQVMRRYKYDIEKKRTVLRTLVSTINDKDARKRELEVERATLAEKRRSIEEEIDVKTKLIKNHDQELYMNDEKLTTVNNRLAINSKMLTLIQRDFRGHLLNNVITFIEERAKEYSHSVFGTDKLAFTLEKNNILIAYDGKDYSCLSGGEKQKLDIIIQFAIRDMLCTFLDFSSNILVLDEITDALDAVGVSKIFNLINSRLNDVEATYIISHHVDELEIPADDEILIIKGDDKISRII